MTLTPAQEAAARYARLGETWLRKFNVTLREARTSLSGRGDARTREIIGPWPTTTRKRLYIVAHEIGHVALGHLRMLPAYVEEFEAEQFAHALMRRDGIKVPLAMTERAKDYVQRKIWQGRVSGRRWFDPDIASWAGADVRLINACAEPSTWHFSYVASMRRVNAALDQ